MKKTVVLGLAASMLLSVNAGAVSQPARQANVKIPIVVTGNSNFKNFMEELNNRLNQFDWSKLPGTPSTPSTPVEPDTPVTPEEPDTPAEPDAPVDTGLSAYAQEVVRLVNVERAKYGLSALTVNTKASQAAQVRAAEQARSFSHTRPNGTSCFTALKEAGVSYRSAGENIAYGQRTPQAVVTAWMNSAGHRANILGSQFSQIGVGYTTVGGTAYWAQFFIG